MALELRGHLLLMDESLAAPGIVLPPDSPEADVRRDLEYSSGTWKLSPPA
jgi:hypothetical protein